ncbi:MAG: hypothetical protein ACP5NK_01920 [Thermoplasmata archaeon]
MKPNLVNDIEEEAEKKGKTTSSVVAEALRDYIEISRLGLRSEDILKSLELLKLIRSLDAIPVPSILLDYMAGVSLEHSHDLTLEKWRERGTVAGNIVKQYAPDLVKLKEMLDSYSSTLPLDFLSMEVSGENVNVVLSGIGYSHQAAICTCEGMVGFLGAYGLEITEKESSESFIRISGRILRRI